MSEARRGQGKHRAERPVSGKHRSQGASANSARRGSAVVAFAGLMGTPTAIAAPAALVAGSIAFAAPAAAATEVPITNLTATLVNPPNNSTIGVLDTITMQWTFDVPAGTNSGDTTVFTVPNYIAGNVNGLDLKDDSGAVIGSVTGSGQSFTLTYGDYVNTHDNVHGTIKTTFSPRESVWGNDTTRDISVTNGTTTAVGGQLTLHYSTVSNFNESTSLAQQNTTPQTDLLYFYSSPQFKSTDVGVVQTTTFSIDPDTQSKATFNCDSILTSAANKGVRYYYGPDKSHLTTYSANSGSDPLGMDVVSCTPTQVTVTYTVAAADMGFTLTLAGNTAAGDAVFLSNEAIATQYTGPFHVTTVRTPATGGTFTSKASARYDYSSAGGGGTQSPKPTIHAYIDDSNPANPTGQTADGQDSDANTTPVTLDPGTQTVSVIVTNTGPVAATGGTLLDSNTGAQVAPIPALDPGQSTVIQLNVTVPEGSYTNLYTAILEGPLGPSAPAADPVNATGVVFNPTAADDTATTDYNTPITVDVLANDSASGTGRPLDPSTLTLLNSAGNPVTSLSVTGGTYTVDSGKITFTPDPGFTGLAAPVTYRVADTAGHTASATLDVTVRTVKPTAADDSATTSFKTPVTIDVLANDSGGAAGVSLDPATLTLVNGSGDAVDSLTVTGGTYTVDNGKITFTPGATFTGQADAVTYRVANDLGETATANVSVGVTTITPTAADDSATTAYKTQVTVDVLANDDSGAPGIALDPSSLRIINSNGDAVTSLNVTGGNYSVVDGKIVFTPDAGFTGQASAVNYRVANETGATATAKVDVTVGGVTPTAISDTADTAFETPVTVDVLANDEGGAPGVTLDGSTLTLLDSGGAAVTSLHVSGGTYAVAGGKITFTPDAGFSGAAPAVSYRVANETGATATTTVQVNVAGVYPHAQNDSATTPYETAVTVDVLANDDAGAPSLTLDRSTLTLINSSGQAVSSLAVNGGTYSVSSGEIVFTPNARFIGTADTVTYRVANSIGKKTTATVKVTVGGVTPYAKPDTATTPKQTPVTIDVLANDSGGAADNPLNASTLTLIDASGNAVSSITVNGGTYKVSNGKIVFTPSCYFQGTAPAVTYRVADSFGTTVSTTVQVTVTGCPPVANPDSATTRPNTPISVNVLYNDYPGSYSTPLVSSTLTLLDDHGNPVSSLSVYGGTYQVSSGRILFTPYYGFVGKAATVSYRVADTAGVTATSTVRVTVGYTCWW